MNTYSLKYSNEFDDQWIFEFDYDALAGTLTGSEIDWAIYQVIDGSVSDLNFYHDEEVWLREAWNSAVSPIPEDRRHLTSLTVHDGRPFTQSDLCDFLANPMLAGIGPFNGVVDGETVSFEQTGNICTDEKWIEIQKNAIREDGIRTVLLRIRGTLRKYLGFRVEEICHEGWLKESIHSVETEGADLFFKNLLTILRPEQQPLHLQTTQVRFRDITAELLNSLIRDPQEIYRISPETFEQLICERLDKMNLEVKRVGKHSYHKDGGIDIIAWPKYSAFPYLMAVQAKHHRIHVEKQAQERLETCMEWFSVFLLT